MSFANGFPRAVESQRDQAQFAPVPGHLRMIPGDIRDMAAGRMPGRLHNKICTVCQLTREIIARSVDDRETIDMFVAVYKDDPFAIRRNSGRGEIAKRRCDRARFAPSQRLAEKSALGDEKDLPIP